MTASAVWANATTAAPSISASASTSKPSGLAVGDGILMVVIGYDDAALTGSDPFVSVGGATNTPAVVTESATERIRILTWVRKVDGTEPGTLTSTLSSSQYHVPVAIPISGLGATIFDTSAPANGRSATQSLAGLTTGNDDEYLVGIKAGYNSTVTGAPSNWTHVAAVDTTNFFYDRTVATAGAVASESLTVSAAEGFASIVLAFRSAAAAGGFPVALLSSHTPFTANYRGS